LPSAHYNGHSLADQPGRDRLAIALLELVANMLMRCRQISVEPVVE
jgi:hypothetical protein